MSLSDSDQWWAPTLEGDPLPPRRRTLTPIQEEQAQAQATAWLQQGVTEIAPHPAWTNNLVIVAKKDGRVRVCIDCTPANKVTKSFDWPLPRLQDLRYVIRGARWFSRIDLKDAFFRIGVPAWARHLTTFAVGGRSYQFRKMPFGLKTAPATFQRFMDRGLATCQEFAFWYIDDILVIGRTRFEVHQNERRVRQRLAEMKCVINEGKSESAKQEILYAGLWVTEQGIGPNREKLSELYSLPVPRTRAEAQSALGLVSYLRDHILLVGHFTAMLYPDKSGLRLHPTQYEAEWARLVRHLQNATVFNHHWIEHRPADLYTDASGWALGAVLMQEGRVIAVAARKLTSAETRYSATDREHLGLVFAAEKFRLILHRRSLVRVWSDHAALLGRKPDRMTPRQARWHVITNHWMPHVQHVKGKENPADFISRWKENGGAEL